MKFPAFFLACFILTFSACLEDGGVPQPDGPIDETLIPRALLLQVDYETLAFEGGYRLFDTEVPYDPAIPLDSFPVEVLYNSPGDFGDLTLRYLPATGIGDTLFFGTIIWAGTGDVIFPDTLEAPDQFMEVSSNDFVGPPPTFFPLTPFQVFEEAVTPEDIFGAVQHLQLVRDALDNSNARLGWFFYPRSVGVGNPAEWDYYVVVVY